MWGPDSCESGYSDTSAQKNGSSLGTGAGSPFWEKSRYLVLPVFIGTKLPALYAGSEDQIKSWNATGLPKARVYCAEGGMQHYAGR
jgi:hypothetical protein